MHDPNKAFKDGFYALSAELGRIPTMKDAGLLALHEEYKRACRPAEETVTREEGQTREEARSTAAPQARAVGSDTRTREDQEWLYAAYIDTADPFGPFVGVTRYEVLSGPDKSAEGPEAVSVPTEAYRDCGVAVGLAEGDRGPGGGLVSKCVKCGRLWERPVKKGRPAIWCGGCRG